MGSYLVSNSNINKNDIIDILKNDFKLPLSENQSTILYNKYIYIYNFLIDDLTKKDDREANKFSQYLTTTIYTGYLKYFKYIGEYNKKQVASFMFRKHENKVFIMFEYNNINFNSIKLIEESFMKNKDENDNEIDRKLIKKNLYITTIILSSKNDIDEEYEWVINVKEDD